MATVRGVEVMSNKFNIVIMCAGKHYVRKYIIGQTLTVSAPFIKITHLNNIC
jgi:hypothetical protein